MNTSLIRSFIETRRQALSAAVEIAARLDLMCHLAPEFCLQALGDARTHQTQKAQLLAGLLRLGAERRKLVARLHLLSDDELLRVLDGLRQRRLNGRSVRELGLAVVLGHPRVADLAANHRLRLVRIIKHLLGERTWSSVCRCLEIPSPKGDRFLRTTVLRFASDATAAREVLCFLAGLGFDEHSTAMSFRAKMARLPCLVVPWLGQPECTPTEFVHQTLQRSALARRDLAAGRGLPLATLSGLRGTFHRDVSTRVLRELSAPAAIRQRADGPVTAAVKQALITGQVVSLDSIVADVGSGQLPAVDVQAAVVLDLSGSATSSGERLYHPAALGLALIGLLRQYVSNLTVFQVGGSTILNGRGIPRPEGPTDLATALLEAARTGPEAILIVTDGYENCRQGDVAQVVEGMWRLGLSAEVKQVTPVIAEAEDLSRRRLSEAIEVVPLVLEAGVGELAARLLLAGQPDLLDRQVLTVLQQLLFAD